MYMKDDYMKSTPAANKLNKYATKFLRFNDLNKHCNILIIFANFANYLILVHCRQYITKT